MDARSNIASHNVSISIDNTDIEIVLAILISREIDASMWFCRLFIQSTMTASQIYGAVSPTTILHDILSVVTHYDRGHRSGFSSLDTMLLLCC